MWNLTKILPRLSEICLYENFVCFLQNLSSSCQSNHIIFNYCQDLARSYKFREDLGKILNFEKATVHWLMAILQSYPATQNISFFLLHLWGYFIYQHTHMYLCLYSGLLLVENPWGIPFPTLETQILLCLWFSFLITD